MLAQNRDTERELAPETRVRVLSRTPFLRLRSDMGRIVRKDEWADYYIVRLDQPATYNECGQPVEELTEIRLDVRDLQDVPWTTLIDHGAVSSVNWWAAAWVPKEAWLEIKTK